MYIHTRSINFPRVQTYYLPHAFELSRNWIHIGMCVHKLPKALLKRAFHSSIRLYSVTWTFGRKTTSYHLYKLRTSKVVGISSLEQDYCKMLQLPWNNIFIWKAWRLTQKLTITHSVDYIITSAHCHQKQHYTYQTTWKRKIRHFIAIPSMWIDNEWTNLHCSKVNMSPIGEAFFKLTMFFRNDYCHIAHFCMYNFINRKFQLIYRTSRWQTNPKWNARCKILPKIPQSSMELQKSAEWIIISHIESLAGTK